nr:MAG TPA: hypothetical protein [Caudoviricetes sp.]
MRSSLSEGRREGPSYHRPFFFVCFNALLRIRTNNHPELHRPGRNHVFLK